MSESAAWLGSRRPEPPEELSARLSEIDVASCQELSDAGRERLGRALERPGRVRDAAFHLLEADALFTYACEAALESSDPARELRDVLSATVS